ncbi:hypothetical protein DE146DRAFT_732124, partial [Phaeosphaeria sp. MPI-PUGE-AT-0046c]
MLPVGFGWSAGDIVKSIEILSTVVKAFKDAGGAASRFKEEVDFLESILKTLVHIQEYVARNPQDKYVVDMARLVSRIGAPLETIRKSHAKYAKYLGVSQQSKMSKFRMAPSVVRYTLRDLAGDVAKRQSTLMQPLEALGALLTLQSLENISKMHDEPLSVSNIQQIVNSFQSSPIFAQLTHTINVLNKCYHATQVLDVTAFESVLGAMNTTQARTMELLRKHCEMQNRLYLDDYWQLRAQSQELKDILTGFQEGVETLSRRAARSADMTRRSSHRKLLMDIRFLLEEHNVRMLSSLGSKQQKVWRPSMPVAIILWIPVYLMSLFSSIAITFTLAYSSSPRCDYSSPKFSHMKQKHGKTCSEGNSDPTQGGDGPREDDDADDMFYASTGKESSKPGGIPFHTRKMRTRSGPILERTYFVWAEVCDAQVIVADLQLFFKDR